MIPIIIPVSAGPIPLDYLLSIIIVLPWMLAVVMFFAGLYIEENLKKALRIALGSAAGAYGFFAMMTVGMFVVEKLALIL